MSRSEIDRRHHKRVRAEMKALRIGGGPLPAIVTVAALLGLVDALATIATLASF